MFNPFPVRFRRVQRCKAGPNQKTGAVYNRRTNNMRTVRTKVYKFQELSEQAQEKALQNLSDINLDYEWYESTYEDAERAGLKIEGFDIDRFYIQGRFIDGALESANKIRAEHGEQCETFKTAAQFIWDRDELVKKYSDGKNIHRVSEENEYDFDNESDELEREFLQSILNDYLSMLRQEYEYRGSKEAIKEAIEANEYEFTQDGKLF